MIEEKLQAECRKTTKALLLALDACSMASSVVAQEDTTTRDGISAVKVCIRDAMNVVNRFSTREIEANERKLSDMRFMARLDTLAAFVLMTAILSKEEDS